MGHSASAQPPGRAERAWTLGELFARAGLGLSARDTHIPVTDICDDSREVTPGACFVAVAGAKAHGRTFIDDALGRGASVVVTEQSIEAPPGSTIVTVPDARAAIAQLSAAFCGLRGLGPTSPRLVGVTGTNGKTTVTWLLRAICKAAGHACGVLGTVEYDVIEEVVAAPLTTPGPVELCGQLARARDAGARFMALEVSSHALDQKRSDGLEFAAAVFTNLTGDHLDYHGTRDAYFAAKRRLFERLRPDAAAVINADDARADALRDSTSARVLTYSIRNPRAELAASSIVVGRSGSQFALRTPRGETVVSLPLVGEHNVANAMAAAGAAEALGIDLASIRKGLECVVGVPGRLQRVEPEGSLFSVLVDYAHTDDALRNVLRAVRPITTGRIICVFGCGGDRDRSKRPRMAAAVEELADVAVVTSDNPRHEAPQAIIDEILTGFIRQSRGANGAMSPAVLGVDAPIAGCELIVEADRRTAIDLALQEAREGDTVLIAGKGHENYQLVGDRVLHFDDVEVARGLLHASANTRLREVCA